MERQRHSGAVVAMVGNVVIGYQRINSVCSDDRFGASSISMLNKCHAACSAVRAAVLMILLLLGSLLLRLAIYLAMELQTLALLLLVVLSPNNEYVVISG